MKIFLIVIVALLIQSVSFASNRGDDSIYDECVKRDRYGECADEGTQILLVVGELIGGVVAAVVAGESKTSAVYSVDPLVKNLKTAESELKKAMHLITVEQHEMNLRTVVEANNNKNVFSGGVRYNPQSAIVSATVKENLINDARLEVTRARAELLKSDFKARIVDKRTGTKIIKGVAIVGTTLMITDLAGRIYVWGSLNRNPTLSPTFKYISSQAINIFSDEEEDGEE